MAKTTDSKERAPQTIDHSSILFRRVLVFLFVLGLVFWQGTTNREYYLNIWQEVVRQLGLGVVLLPATLLVAVVLLRRNPRSWLSYWNLWLGALGLGIAFWGTLGLVRAETGILREASLGGAFGMWLAGPHLLLALAKLTTLYLGSLWLTMPRLGTKVFVTLARAGAFVLWLVLYYLWRSFLWAVGYLALGFDALVRRLRKDKARQPQEGVALPFPGRATPSNVPEYGRFAPETPAKEMSSLRPSFAAAGAPSSPARTMAMSGVRNIWGRLTNPSPVKPVPDKKKEETPKKAPAPADDTAFQWRLPPIDILELDKEVKPDAAENDRRARIIEETLASFGIESQVVEINPGPTVTQFGLKPGWINRYREVRGRGLDGRMRIDKNGNPVVRQELVSRTRVTVDAITAREKDLSLALAAPSIRIEAPVPGKPVIGIEVPNTSFTVVPLRGIIQSTAFQRLLGKTSLAVALGRGSGGEEAVTDLGQMPHVLIAGATGTGKSVCISSVLACLLMHNTPDDLRLVLIDPKRVELVAFNGVPQLITPAVTKHEKVPEVLDWVLREMDERYNKFNATGTRNIEAYNRNRQKQERLPYIVIAIDELADLMLFAPVDVENKIIRLAQLGRATGIHMVLATQRPSVDVITGLIKANIPTRISFAVSSLVDSRVILDYSGAEKLLGRGDMLYQPQDAQKPKRLQGTFVSDKEIERLVNFWVKQKSARLYTAPIEKIEKLEPFLAKESQEKKDGDPLLAKARDLALQYDRISTNLIQRKLGVGFPKASRLVELLESEGVVAPGEPGKSREVIGQRKGAKRSAESHESPRVDSAAG